MREGIYASTFAPRLKLFDRDVFKLFHSVKLPMVRQRLTKAAIKKNRRLCMNDRKVKEDKNLTCLWRCPPLRQKVFG